MRSTESASSVFYHSQEEDPVKMNTEGHGPCREPVPGTSYHSYHNSTAEGSPATIEPDVTGKNCTKMYSMYIKTDYNWYSAHAALVSFQIPCLCKPKVCFHMKLF